MKEPTKLSELIAAVERIANARYDGHYTIFSFTTEYKGCFGTPDRLNHFDKSHSESYYELQDDIAASPSHGSLLELLYAMAEHPERYTIKRQFTRHFRNGDELVFLEAL